MKEYVRGCTGKRKYATEALANEINAAMVAKGNGPKLHAYQCGHCGCWHHSNLTPEQAEERHLAARRRRARFNGGRYV